MREITSVERTPQLIEQLVTVWESSVRSSHHFLSSQEIASIKTCVPTALVHIPHLIVEFRADGMPSAFMGIDSNKLEMLFIAPEAQGTGLGKTFIEYAIANFDVNQVTVNEQNPQARGFYEHMGFNVYQRSELDEQGNPYPILHMRLHF